MTTQTQKYLLAALLAAAVILGTTWFYSDGTQFGSPPVVEGE
ncbi:hypothetical protein [Pararhizobium haloflavum]|nr:hypothetical protein [Pararhizobium haloflavum]